MRQRHPLRRSVLVRVLAVATLTLMVGCASGASPAPSAGTAAASQPAEESASTLHLRARQAVPARSQVSAEPPTAVRLPSGVVLPVRATSTRANGLLDVPSDPRVAGWWRGGARLGDPFGATLLAAHVDSSTQGLGPFVEVLQMRRGEMIELRSRHWSQRFAVRELRVVAQGPLSAHRWIYSPRGERRLVLVTCAPPYDAAHGGYQNLAVAVAHPVAPPVRSPR